MNADVEKAVAVTHADLVARAERWLRTCGCRVVLRDPFKAASTTGEQPDAIGWRDGLSILVEAKVSRADFLADRRKPFRADPTKGMGDWRFYLCPPGIITADDLPDGWGLLWAHTRKIERVRGGPNSNWWWGGKPFEANLREEARMLVSSHARIAAHLGANHEQA